MSEKDNFNNRCHSEKRMPEIRAKLEFGMDVPAKWSSQKKKY